MAEKILTIIVTQVGGSFNASGDKVTVLRLYNDWLIRTTGRAGTVS